MQTIHQIIRQAEDNYIDNPVSISKYVDFDMHNTIETIDAYLNSKHISGSKDSLGRDKPFFNIVTAIVNVWYRATDIDRKDIRIMPPSLDKTAHAFVATVHLHQWMKEAKFGTFLNDWGRSLARYGSSVTKFVEKNGQLICSVIPWNRMIVDPIDFDVLPRIEKLYLTPAQLKQNKLYDQEVVKSLLDNLETRQTLDGQQKDESNKFIELYEVHGELPLSLLTDKDKDDDTYRQQIHVVAYQSSNNKGEYDDFTLYRGKEAQDPYLLTHLIPEDGRTLAIGAVESLFEAQWMVNHSQKNIKDTLDLASKLIFQTADTKYAGRNVLSAIENGDIMVHDANKPLTQINNSKADISAFQNFSTSWQNLAAEITSTPDAMKGNTLPSGTPYSLGAYLGAQANSLFEIMTENKGLYIEEMMRRFIIKHLKTKMNSSNEIMATLDENAIIEIDAMYVPKEAIRRHNQEVKDMLLNAPQNPMQSTQTSIPSPYQPDVAEAKVRKDMSSLGNKRSFKPDEINETTWNDVLKNFEMTATVEVTNENTDKQAILTTLSSVLQTVAGNPAILQDPNAKMLFNAILTETGRISPLQLSTAQSPTNSPPGGDSGALTELNNINNGKSTTSAT